MLRRFWVTTAVLCAACKGGDAPSDSGAHPRIYLAQNKARLAAALAAQGSAAQRFQSVVDQWVGGADVYGFEPWNAALVGQLTGDAKYCKAAVAAVDAEVAAANAAIGSGQAPAIAGDDYLNIGDDIGNLALVYDWCYDAVGDRAAWLTYANQAVTNVWNPMTAAWNGTKLPWDGWAIDDPDDNYYYSFMRATALLGLAAHGEYTGIDAISEFYDTKLGGELIPNFDSDLVGGGSREGTGYGVQLREMWEIYDLWNASMNEDIATMTPQTRASMLDFIHQTLPTLDRVAPTGDQSRDSTASFFDYDRQYLLELVRLFPSDPLAPRVLALLQNCSIPQMTEPFMYAYDFMLASDLAPTTLDGLGTTYLAPGTGQFYARSGWDTHATWINLNAGPYTESHAHQDQGALMIYKDGWLAYDPVIDSHSGLPQTVDDHGTLRVVKGGQPVAQKIGQASTVLALHAGTSGGVSYAHIAADLTAFEGSDATLLQREVVYLAPDTVVIYDRATTPASDQQVWSLAFHVQPAISGATATVTNAGHTLTVQRLGPSAAAATVYDYDANSDFATGYRLDETLPGGDARWLHVATIDGAATGATSSDGNSVDLMLGSAAVHVAFAPDGVGGTLEIAGQTIALGSGIDALPE